jgi:hypothetical protein
MCYGFEVGRAGSAALLEFAEFAVRMGSERAKVRVLIPTTSGTVEILLLAEEDPAIGRSVACIGGTTQVADIDAAYHAFVARPTGVVERLFGHSCYRLDVSGRIDAGASWQLGTLVAHALHAAGRLAQEGEGAGMVIWATGTVRSVDLSIGGVSHVAEKLALSLDLLRQEAEAGRRILVAVPAQNAADVSPQLRESLAASGVEVLEFDALGPLWTCLELSPGSMNVREIARGPAAAPARPWRVWGRPGDAWRRRLPWAAGAVLLLLLAGGGLGAWWTLSQPDVAHYRALVWRRGLPGGLGRIDAETHAHLFGSYLVTKQSGRVVEVRWENSAGALQDDKDGHARWVVRYRESGKAEKIEVYRRNGRLVREERLEWSGDKLIVYFAHGTAPQAQDATQMLTIDPFGKGSSTDSAYTLVSWLAGKSEITRHELTFDRDGLVSERRYQNAWGTPVKDGQGSYGQRLSYTPSGLVQRRAEIGPDDAEITLKNGIRAVFSSYDRQYRLVRLTLIGADGRQFDGPDWYAYYEVEHDRWGNATTTRYFGSNGKPALRKGGFAAVVQTYDARGNLVKEGYLDTEGTPTLHPDGFAREVRSYDARGNLEIAYLGVDGKPALHRDGFAKEARIYGARGNVVEEAYFDIDGKPTLGKGGFAKLALRYDESDNPIEWEYFGIDGMAAFDKWGVARIKQTYDARGYRTKREYFGVDGRPTLGPDGCAGCTWAYDERGNMVEVALSGIDGKPIAPRKYGFAKITYAYDAHGNVTRVTFFGVDGEPTLQELGYAKAVFSYDARGNIVRGAMFGVDGKPTLKHGFAKFEQSYDARGNLTEIAYFGIDGKPILVEDGQAKSVFTYDGRGNIVGYAYFDVDGKPILTKHGYARVADSHDSRGNVIERKYFGLDGAPTRRLPENLAARIRFVRDLAGRLVTVEYFGLDDRPVAIEAAVAKVAPESLAHKIGFRAGDRLAAYRGEKVGSKERFAYLRERPSVGDAAITVLRGKERLSLVVPAGRPLELELLNVTAHPRSDER